MYTTALFLALLINIMFLNLHLRMNYDQEYIHIELKLEIYILTFNIRMLSKQDHKGPKINAFGILGQVDISINNMGRIINHAHFVRKVCKDVIGLLGLKEIVTDRNRTTHINTTIAGTQHS
ncbi:hypothetical protein ACJX0J_013256, partial [Zea mays]